MNYPPDSAMAVRYPTSNTRSVPGGTIGNNSISNPTDTIDKDKQAKLDALKKQYEDYNLKKQTEYQANIDKYNQDKLTYDKELADYNKQLEDYNTQKADYEKALSDYNNQLAAQQKDQQYLNEATRIIPGSWNYDPKATYSPLALKGTPAYSYYNHIVEARNKASDSILYAYEHHNLTDSEISKYGLRPYDSGNPTNVTTPEGYYDVGGTLYPIKDLSQPNFNESTPVNPLLTNDVFTQAYNNIKPTVNQVNLPQNVIRPNTSNLIIPNNPFTNDIFTQSYNQNKVNTFINPNLNMNQINNPVLKTVGVQPTITNIPTFFDLNEKYNVGGKEFTSKTPGLFSYPTLEQAKANLNMNVASADTLGQQYNFDVKNSGYVQGTIDFLGSKFGEAYDVAQQKGLTSNYQQEGVRNLLNAAPNLVYFSPIAPELFVAKGTEELINPDIVKTEDPLFKTYQPFMDIGLGLVGIRGQVAALREENLLSALENQKIKSYGTINEETGAVTKISGKITKPTEFDKTILGLKPTAYISKIELMPLNTPEGEIQNSIGIGTNIKVVEGSTKIPYENYLIKANSQDIESPASIIKRNAKVELSNTKPSISDISTKRFEKGVLDTSSGKIKDIKLNQPIETNTYVGLSTQEGENINIISGKARSLDINKNIDFAATEKQGLYVEDTKLPNKLIKSNEITPNENALVTKDYYENKLVNQNNKRIKQVNEFTNTKESGLDITTSKKLKADFNELGQLKIVGNGETNVKIEPNANLNEGDIFNVVSNKGNLKANLPEDINVNIGNTKGQTILQSKVDIKVISDVAGGSSNELLTSNINQATQEINFIKPSQFAGTGTYERYSYSENLNAPKVKYVSSNVINDLSGNKLGNLNGTGKIGDLTGTGNIEGLGNLGKIKNLGVQETVFSSMDKVKPIQPSFNIQKPDELNRQRPRENQIISQPSKTDQLLKQSQKLKQPEPVIPKLNTGGGSNDIKNPPPITINIPKIKSILEEKQKKVKKLKKGYDVLRRRKGKIEKIGRNLPLGKATKLGVDISKSSLTQTFALKESGITQDTDINYKLPSQLFTAPKSRKTMISELTFVERRGKTLTSRSEVSAFQKAKDSFFK